MQDVCVCVYVHAYTLPEKYQYNPWLGHRNSMWQKEHIFGRVASYHWHEETGKWVIAELSGNWSDPN